MIFTTKKYIAAALLVAALPIAATADESATSSAKYKALICPPPTFGSTWAILDRDGANNKVAPYLSSLGKGEAGTGIVTSPPFKIAVKTITFTICGHDGQAGDLGKNYIALVDARKGNTLVKTVAPGNDAMQERTWDVSKFKGIEVRIELRDGDAGSGFAWFGIGRIDAGPAIKIDFRQGMPDTWSRPQSSAEVRYELVTGPVPFKRHANAFSLMPKTGAVDIPCGFTARRLYVLGGTINGGKQGETYGNIEIHYPTGSPDVVPLMVGFTLDRRYKRLSPSKAIHLHTSADPFQYYLVIKPKDAVIKKIRLVATPDTGSIPRITAITCETTADSDRLMLLPDTVLPPREAAWIKTHTINPNTLNIDEIIQQFRKAN